MRSSSRSTSDQYSSLGVTHRARRSVLLGLIAILAVIAAACGSTSTDVATSSDSADESAGADTTGAAASGDDAEADADEVDDSETMSEAMEDYYSPISEALGQDNFSFDEDQMAEQEREVQLATRECMLTLGFEYDIVDSSQMMQFGGAMFDEDLTRKEFVEKYGFGYSTQFEEQFEMFDAEELATDPNNERMMSMGENESQAYQEALWGKNPFEDAEFDPTTGEPLDPDTGEPVDMTSSSRTTSRPVARPKPSKRSTAATSRPSDPAAASTTISRPAFRISTRASKPTPASWPPTRTGRPAWPKPATRSRTRKTCGTRSAIACSRSKKRCSAHLPTWRRSRKSSKRPTLSR